MSQWWARGTRTSMVRAVYVASLFGNVTQVPRNGQCGSNFQEMVRAITCGLPTTRPESVGSSSAPLRDVPWQLPRRRSRRASGTQSEIPTPHQSDTSGTMSVLPGFVCPHNERTDVLSGRTSNSPPWFMDSIPVVLPSAPVCPSPRTRFAQWLHADHPQFVPQLSHRLRRGWKGKQAPSTSHRRRYASRIWGSGYGGHGRACRDFDPAWRFCRAVRRARRPVF